MQATTATYDAAVIAAFNRPTWRLRVDWNRNGSYADTWTAPGIIYEAAGAGGGGGTPVSHEATGTADVAGSGTTTSIVGNVPGGASGVMWWAIVGNVTTGISTPAGWQVGPTVAGSAVAIYLFWRVASSEPASYTATVPSGRWSSQVSSYAGVDTGTPQDVTATTSTSSENPPAITPSTAGAMVVTFGGGRTTTAGATSTWTSSDATLRQNASMATAGTNVTHGSADAAWTSGALDLTLTSSQALTGPCSIAIALRPAAPGGGGGGVPLVGPSRTLPLDDLTADVVDCRLGRELETDLPEQARLFAGSASANATVILAHRDPDAPTQHTAWYYSPLNTASPLYSVVREGAPAILEVGYITDAGPEYLTVLVGRVRSLDVDRGGQTATMVLSDPAADMRKQVQLPTIIADGADPDSVRRPGLNLTFLADWTARKCGYYASPPQRAGCKFLATMHGSGWAEVGTTVHHHGNNGTQLAYSPTPTFGGSARWVQAVNTDGSSGQAMVYLLGGSGIISPNNTRTCLVQGWWKLNSAAVNQPLWILYNTAAGPTGANPFLTAYRQTSTGNLQVLFNRGGADPTNRAVVGPSVSPGTSAFHYYAFLISFTSTGVTVTFRYDTTTTGPTTTATPSVTGGPEFDRIWVNSGRVDSYLTSYCDGLAEDVQATTESSIGPGWDNAFVPSAEIWPSGAIDNRLVATPPTNEQGWTLLQQIAAAEFATAGFTETGKLFYWPRDRWTRAPYTTSQRTLTPSTGLKDLATTSSQDQVRNRVIIRAVVPIVGALAQVWTLGSRWSISAGATLSKIVETSESFGDLDTGVVYGTAGGSSRYLAGTALNGTGNQVSNLTFVVSQLSPTTIALAITNPNGFRVYMAGDNNASGEFDGKPYLILDAYPVDFNDQSRERAEPVSASSIAAYGFEQVLEIPDSVFRQDADDLDQLAADLLADLAFPKPAILDVPVIGDPRLQLGDRVTITDPDGLAFTADFHISKIGLTISPTEGLAMTISLRGA